MNTHVLFHLRLASLKVLLWISLRLIRWGHSIGYDIHARNSQIEGFTIPRILLDVETTTGRADIAAQLDFNANISYPDLPVRLRNYKPSDEQKRRDTIYVTARSIEELGLKYWKLLTTEKTKIRLNYI